MSESTHENGNVFNYDEPLPVFPDYRARSWEPAKRHYVDLTETEKSEQ